MGGVEGAFVELKRHGLASVEISKICDKIVAASGWRVKAFFAMDLSLSWDGDPSIRSVCRSRLLGLLCSPSQASQLPHRSRSVQAVR
ncbi:protein farnesyltransferase/geranylgeranyltransferase type-1 subunit alpha [Corchorus olitorius]|uniref:Protein farnesyltransferase/geranylgeranyltransferase type-1 subunit alpha n=1 Tax=Corchorus olitorius TaxID=93759 RepID=A0A1R3L344_9ROSI|nr:protein farnesyltransferase/geranylgeranyltransferase type-1 subunit alpha [Corchorus olitorius]